MDNLTKRVKSAYKSKLKGGRTSSASSKANRSNQDLFKNQISNYETRLQNAGIDSKKAKDTRNPVEKLLNLKQDQNVLFDIFELINRPQQALFTGIDNAIKGKDFVKGLGEGISGKKTTTGGKILRDLGMEGNDKANLFTKEGRKNIHLSDVLGFGLDLFADPIDLAVAPVKVTSTAGKAVRAADNIADIAKGSKGLKLVKAADKVGDTAKGITAAKAGLNTLGDVGKVAATEWKPLSSALLSYAGKGIKKGAKVGDNILEKALSKSDAKSLKKAEEYVAKKGGDIENALREIGRSSSKLDTYKGIKDQLSRTVDSSKNLMGLTRKAREAENISNVNREYGKLLNEDLLKDIDKASNNFAELGFKSKEEATDNIIRNLSHATENEGDWLFRGKDVINNLVENKNVYVHSKENADEVVKALKEYGIKAEANGDKVKLIGSKNKLYNIQDDFADRVLGTKVSKEAKETMDKATEFFNQNDELRNLYNKSQASKVDYAKFNSDVTGTNFENIVTNPYVKHSLNENIPASEAQAFKARKYDVPIAEANRMKQLEKAEEIKKINEKSDKISKTIYETTDDGIIKTDNAGNPIRNKKYMDNLIDNHNNNINRIKSNLASQEELMKASYKTDDAGKIIRNEAGEAIRKDIDVSSVDPSKLNKKDTKIYNRLVADEGLREVTADLKKIKFEDIDPANTKYLNNVSESYKDYTKWVTSYKQELMKKKPNERKLDFIKAFVDSSKKQVTADITVAKSLANKQARQAISKANKAYREGKSVGMELQKAMDKLKISQKKNTDVFNAIVDNVDNLQGKLKYEQETLKKLLSNKEGLADEIYRKKVKTLEENAKAVATLSDPKTQEFFKTSFDENFIDYVNRGASYTEGANKLNEALSVGIFNNKQYVMKASDLGNKKVPYNFEKVNPAYIKNKLSYYKSMLPENAQKTFDYIMNNLGDEAIYMDKDFTKYLGVSTEAAKETAPLLKFFDSINNTFKKFSTLTLGFQERNIIGNSTNMVLSGVKARELPEYYKKAHALWNKADDLMKKSGTEALTKAEQKELETLMDFYKGGFADAFIKGQGMEAIKSSKGALGKVSKASAELNQTVDTYNRLTLLMYAKDHPEYVKKLGRKDAVEAVKMVLFDPDNMSDLERNVFKKIIPFYTFTKQNLMFQAENVMKNTPRYNKLFKALNKAYDSVGEDKYYQYQKEAMQIPIPFTDGKGNQLFLKSNLPVSDLGEFMGDPLGRLAASTSPVIKTPYELKSGKSMFTGEDINYKTLSNTLNKLGVRDQGIENAAQAAETILNNFGLQNVSTNLISKVSSILDRNNDDKSNQQLWAEIFKSVLQNTKQESVENVKLYNELEQYQSILRRLKQQGVEVPTMTEINKMKLNRFKNKRASLR